jgi:hypothetical protein
MKRHYKRFASRPLNIAVHIVLVYYTFIFFLVSFALRGDLLTLSTAGVHMLYFILTIDHRRAEKGKAVPLFSDNGYRVVRALCLLVIAGVALYLDYALGSFLFLFDVRLWTVILTA